MILVERNNSNEIAFTAVDQIQYGNGFYKLIFKSSVTKQERYVIPTVVTENARYILLEFVESLTNDPDNGRINLRGGFYPNGQYTYELWETDDEYEELALIESGEMKLMGENINPEIQYYFYTSNNENASSYVYVEPSQNIGDFETMNIAWENDTNNWETPYT